MECVVLILCGLLLPAFLLAWSCRVAGIFRVAGYDAGTVVVSPRRGFCVGGLPVDICTVSNVEVYGCHNNGEISEECVCTHVSVMPSMMEGELLCEIWFFALDSIPDCESVALRIQHAMRLRRFVICGLSCCTYFSTLSHKRRYFRNKK